MDPVRQLLDELGDGEWERFGCAFRWRSTAASCAAMSPKGADVLEIGAGPGRFTIELARMGCRVVVSDVSAVQLALNERHVAGAGNEAAVADRRLLDVRDLSCLPDAAFDAVVAYGGPLSYAFEEAESCLGEMLRVVRPGGTVVASVMELIGTLRLSCASSPPTRLRRAWRPSRR